MGVLHLHKLLHLLVKPAVGPQKSASGSTTSVNDSFNQLLHASLTQAHQAVENDTQYHSLRYIFSHCINDTKMSIRWRFVSTLLDLMVELKLAIDEEMKAFRASKIKATHSSGAPPMSPDTLSFDQQKAVMAALQFVSALGIYPCLQPGVGIPLTCRSGFAELIQPHDSSATSSDPNHTQRLTHCVHQLLRIKSTPSLATLVYRSILNDLLAGLCQLVHGDGETLTDASANERAILTRELETLLSEVYQPLIIRELLMLQGTMPARPPAAKKPHMPATKHKGVSAGVSSKPPAWLRSLCIDQLVVCITKLKGLQNALAALIPPTTVHTQGDWKTSEAVATIITKIPVSSLCNQDNAYQANVSAQAFQLLHHEQAVQYRRVVISIITSLYHTAPHTVAPHIDKMMAPLFACQQSRASAQDYSDGDCIVTADALRTCIQDMHILFTSAAVLKIPDLLQHLTPAMHVLFCMYSDISTDSNIRSAVEELLVTYLTHMQCAQCVTLCYVCVFNTAPTTTTATATTATTTTTCSSQSNTVTIDTCCHPHLVFTTAQQGGITAVFDAHRSSSTTRCSALGSLLSRVKRNELSAEIFLVALEELGRVLDTEGSEEVSRSVGGAIRTHDTDTTHIRTVDDSRRVKHHLQLLELVAELSEQLDPSVIQDTSHIVHFAKITLARTVTVLSHGDTAVSTHTVFDSESVTMALSLLVALLADSKKLKRSDFMKLQELQPLLQKLETLHPDASVQTMCSDIVVAIGTQCLVMGHTLADIKLHDQHQQQANGTGAQHRSTTHKKVLIEELEQTDSVNNKDTKDVSDRDSESGRTSVENECTGAANGIIKSPTSPASPTPLSPQPVQQQKQQQQQQQQQGDDILSASLADLSQDSELRQALLDVCDPNIANCGHGLLQLARLLEQPDISSEVSDRLDMLQAVFIQNLSHGESYVYLPAVRALSALACRYPADRLKVIVEAYERQTNVPVKLNLGEALVKVSRVMGDMMPHYKLLLLPVLLQSTKHNDPLVRAGSLANIGEICKLLQFSLSTVIGEIFVCCESILSHDSSPDVRKGAAMLLTLLLQGVQPKHLQSIGSMLRSVYRLLKQTARSDDDEVVRLHASLALDEIDRVMRDVMFPKETLTKQLYVLDPPPHT